MNEQAFNKASKKRHGPAGDGIVQSSITTTSVIPFKTEAARLRSVLDSMSEGFALFSPDFIILDVNAETLRLETRSRDQIIGHSHWALYPGTEEGPLGALYKKAMTERVAVSLEHEYIWPDGRLSWLDMRAYPTEDGCLAVFFRDVTDRRIAEQKVLESAERLEGAVRAFADVLWTNDAEGRMSSVQPGWASLTGQTFEEYGGYGWTQAVHPDDAQSTVEAWRAAVAEKRLFVFEHRVRRHDGVWRRFAIRAAPVINRDGTIREWVGVHSDITDERESEVRFRQLAENIDAAFYINEIDEQRMSYVSPSYERIWNQPATEIYADANAYMRDVHVDDRPHLEAARKRLRAGENTETRYRLVRRDGSVRHIHARSFLTTNAAGGRRAVGIAEDVTEMTEVQLQLSANAATFEMLVRNNPFGVFVLGSDFRLLHLSIGATMTFAGIEPPIGRDFAEIIHILWKDPFATELIERFRLTLASGESYISKDMVEHRNNVDRVESYDWRIDRITLPGGTLGLVCHFYNLSERKALEALLRQALLDKDILLREIDHRVRNSLAMISSLVSMQSEASASSEVKQALGVASTRLLAVAQMHERLYKGKELGVVEFGTYLEEICRDIQESIGQGNMTMASHITPVDLKVNQAVPLGLIANELLTNAFKHCGDSAATINVELNRRETVLELTVWDTGVGIPTDYDSSKNSGLGTKVIAMLVRQLNGELVTPVPGGMAHFQVNIPLVRELEPEGDQHTSSPKESS